MLLRSLIAALALAGGVHGQARPDPAPLARDILAAHTAVRARLRLRPLTWSARLESWARIWAEALLQRHEFAHRPKNPFGENLFAVVDGRVSPAQVVRSWASEAADYDYESNGCRRVCGHYTQIVWRNTREVGCAVAQSANRQVWVCNYNPPGNVVGQRPY
jgi:pathogenesis-related protein 1